MILLRYENMRKEELEVIGSAWDILGHAGVAYLLEDLGAFATVVSIAVNYEAAIRELLVSTAYEETATLSGPAVGDTNWRSM
jgi:hypothetical protein